MSIQPLAMLTPFDLRHPREAMGCPTKGTLLPDLLVPC